MKFFKCEHLQRFGISNIFSFRKEKSLGKEVFGYKLFSNTGKVLLVFVRKPYFTTPHKLFFWLESHWDELIHLPKVTGN